MGQDEGQPRDFLTRLQQQLEYEATVRVLPGDREAPRGRRKSLLLHLQLEIDRGGRILGLLH